jgi:hypothetical protein
VPLRQLVSTDMDNAAPARKTGTRSNLMSNRVMTVTLKVKIRGW